jgi:hypothetical protein
MTTLRARFDGKVLVPLERVDLPIGRELQLQITEADPALPDEYRPGSPAAILRVMREGPHVSREDVDELERMIAAGKSPPVTTGAFDDLDGPRR